MRLLVLLRGVPGCGKSTWVKQNNLEKYTISPDFIRLMVQSPIIDKNGRESISQLNDGKVWKFLFNILEERMSRGEFTVIDATHSRSKLINQYKKLCNKYRYRCVVVNFEKPLETIITQNKNREQYKQVPEVEIIKVFERLKTDNIPSWVKVIQPEEFKTLEDIQFDFTDKFEKIVVFGDIHGCYNPLEEYFNNNPFNESNFYVFVGDYFDRGIQNVEVFKFLTSMMHNKNVLLLQGNHCKHLFSYINDEEIKTHAAKVTFKEFEDANITKQDVSELYRKLAQFAYFKFYDNVYVITHGGIPSIPSIYYATDDYINGVGKYEDNDLVDNSFIKSTPTNYISIYGHRNVYNDTITTNNRTFNLNDRIEYGGNLRILEITKDNKHNEIYIPNTIFSETKIDREHTPTLIDSMTSEQMVFELKNSNDIKETKLENNVSSFNFVRNVFFKKQWNDITIRARGLFVDTETNKVVARGYEKFFNIGERKDTSIRYLQNNFMFPVCAYRKYNGFLGLLSVHNGEWFITSKSTNTGDFAELFKTLVTPYLTDKLKKFIEKENVTFVCEVIDPINDPHIIEYDNAHVILLDIIHNDFKYKAYDYVALSNNARKFGFECKKCDYVFDEFGDFYRFYVSQERGFKNVEPLEGWVFEDSNGLMVKYKTKYYQFWKSMRNLKDKIVKRGDTPEIKNKLHTLKEFEVYNYMITIDDLKNKNIIQIRNEMNVKNDN